MQKLLAGVPLDAGNDDQEVSVKDIEESLKGIQGKMEKDL